MRLSQKPNPSKPLERSKTFFRIHPHYHTMDSIYSEPLTILRDEEKCILCGLCARMCTTGKITAFEDGKPVIRKDGVCIACGQCIAVCPEKCLSTDTAGYSKPMKADRAGITAEMLSGYLMSRRSVRTWKDKPVPKELITRLIEVSGYAPSACNTHPVKWIAVIDPARIREFVAASIEFLNTIPGDDQMAEMAGMLLQSFAAGKDPVCRDAPALLIAAVDSKQDFGLIDSVIALSTIDTYAPSLDLGTCWVGFVMILLQRKPELGKILGIPDNWTPQYSMLIGYPGVSFKQIPPRKMPEIRWG